jgi:DNA polymerase III gamma/tau subunit
VTALYNKYRPRKLEDMVGQEPAVKALQALHRRPEGLPHALLFYGPTGTGKTTAARIVALRLLRCPPLHFRELNCAADARGIDTVRDMTARYERCPLGTDRVVWYLDEAHKLTPDAQSGMLKILEDEQPHAYFILASTDPAKILPTARGRCTPVEMRVIGVADLTALVARVVQKERLTVGPALAAQIADAAGGSARKALVLLEKVAGLPDADRLPALAPEATLRAAFDLVKAMMPFRGAGDWRACQAVLADVRGEEAEGVRQMILHCAHNHLMNQKDKGLAAKAYKVVNCFRERIWDPGLAGQAVLAANVYEACREGGD